MHVSYCKATCLALTLAACGGGSGGESSGSPSRPVIPPPEPETPAVILSFSDQTQTSNLEFKHTFRPADEQNMPMMYSGGVTVGDYDNDGDLDLYMIAGNRGTNHLFQNQGDGTYIELASEAGVAVTGVKSIGPAFGDVNGDGWLDLFVGAVDSDPYYLFINNQDGTFTDHTSQSGLIITAPNSVSTTFGDIDNDGDLDMLISHWGNLLDAEKSLEIVWRNDLSDGVAHFTDVSTQWGLSQAYAAQIATISEQNPARDSSFVPSLSDIDSDGDLDLLLVSDYGHTKILTNQNGESYENTTSTVINDQFGMGSSVGDYDNDGDMDWYVTSIHEKATDNQEKNPSQGYTGNRLYTNDGAGNFTNKGAALKVADGGWAWASCFADFNNDGLTDIFHVNGWGQDGLDFSHYQTDRSRLYLQQNGEFVESALSLGIEDSRQGRGIGCNDMDGDGDIDIIISNNQDYSRLYRNDLSSGHHYLIVRLQGKAPNTQALGARITLNTADGNQQYKEMRSNNNFASSNAAEAHFGLGTETEALSLSVRWPDGSQSEFTQIAVDQIVLLEQP